MTKLFGGLISLACLLLAGCGGSSGPRVVVYCALDREFAEPVLARFQKETGIEVQAVYDVESTKTVGLTNRLLAEKGRPQCDLFWNNEILNTLRLHEAGLLAPYEPREAAEFPAAYRAADKTWHGFAARARVLIVNTELLPNEQDWPRTLAELAEPKWKGKVGIAKPLFGTTATHAACLWTALGEDRAKDFLHRLRENAKIMSGNKQVATAVASGELVAGLTDTDDAIIEKEKGLPVTIIYPDAEGMGTLFIPNTLALIVGGPHPAEAKKLADFLLTAQVEEELARSPSAQIPLHHAAKGSTRVKTPAETKAMEIDFSAAAKNWGSVAKFLAEEFGQ